MLKRTYTLLIIAALAFVAGCQKQDSTTTNEGGAGSCIPITKPDEFIFLAWYEIIDIYEESMLEEAEALLTLGDRVGINIITECDELHDPAMTKMAVETMSKHPSLYAYNVWDDWVEDLYLETVRNFLKTVPVSFLSFDNYPVIINENGERVLREAWYHNLEDIRTAALEADIPIWGFALAKSLGDNPHPTLGDLRLQQFSNLVYGAVAFQYFTARAIVWKDSVTEFYPLIKQVNEELKQMEDIFLGADIKDIWHTGSQIPNGTRALTRYPAGISKIKTGDGGAVVSHFTNKGKQYVAIVNRSCTDATTLEIAFNGAASHVSKDGVETSIETSYTIEPGDIKIFTWE